MDDSTHGNDPSSCDEGGIADSISTPEIAADDPETDTYTTWIDRETESVAVAVISAVAAVSNTDPVEMDPLQAVVDTDALETIFQSDAIGLVIFTYHGREVVVHHDGEIEVTQLDC